MGFGVLKFGFVVAQPMPAPAPQPPPVQDPLMNLMMSQPKIDVEAEVTATASFDPPAIRPGQQTIYRVTFNNGLEESIQWPAKLSLPAGLEAFPSAEGQVFHMAGPTLVPITTFNSRISAATNGVFTVPEFTVPVYGRQIKIPAAQLTVSPNAPLRSAAALLVQASDQEVFTGQPLSVRLVFPSTAAGGIQGLQQVQFRGQGFIVDQTGSHQQIGNVTVDGTNVIAYTYNTVITPIISGKIKITVQGFTAGMRFSAPIVISGNAMIQGGAPQYTLLESDPLEINVRPLPREAELPGFTGIIDKLTLDPPTLSTSEAHVGEAVKLSVTVRGSTNFLRIVAPKPAPATDWEILSSPTNSLNTQLVQTPNQPQGQRLATFTYTLIPLSEKVKGTPAIPFSSFDPHTGSYQDLTIPSLPITVKPGDVPLTPEVAALLQPSTGPTQDEEELVLSGLATLPGRKASSLRPLQQTAWFPLIQLAPAAFFFGLWYWDQRRRFLEAHPEIVLRRRARRALHREWRVAREAARAGDAKAFSTAAVRAMRAACAPHYPADPRAVVGRDVLALLNEPERNGTLGGVVRRFFSTTDALQFGTAAAHAGELLSQRNELELVLGTLEARL